MKANRVPKPEDFVFVYREDLQLAPSYAELTPFGRTEIVHVITTLGGNPTR